MQIVCRISLAKWIFKWAFYWLQQNDNPKYQPCCFKETSLWLAYYFVWNFWWNNKELQTANIKKFANFPKIIKKWNKKETKSKAKAKAKANVLNCLALGTVLWIPNFLFPQVEIVLYNLLRNSTIEIKSNNGLEWNKNEGA